jgi:hypothetical protein
VRDIWNPSYSINRPNSFCLFFRAVTRLETTIIGGKSGWSFGGRVGFIEGQLGLIASSYSIGLTLTLSDTDNIIFKDWETTARSWISTCAFGVRLEGSKVDPSLGLWMGYLLHTKKCRPYSFLEFKLAELVLDLE